MKIAKQKETNLAYQKQLLNTLKNIVDFRTNLFTNSALLANGGKEKEWSSITSMGKFIKKQLEKTDDSNLRILVSVLTDIEEPILQLENNLELKNLFKEIISKQTLKEEAKPASLETLH